MYLTELKDALIIVPTTMVWVAIKEDSWLEAYADGSWNDVNQKFGGNLNIRDVKMGTLKDVWKYGYIIRPVEEYKDFKVRGICIKRKKGDRQIL